MITQKIKLNERRERMVERERMEEIIRLVARKQMRDLKKQDFEELVNEAWLGVMEALEKTDPEEINEGWIWRVATCRLIRWKLKMRSILSIPEGTVNKRSEDLDLGSELRDELVKGEAETRGSRREEEIRMILKLVRKEVEKELGWVEKKLQDNLMDGGSITEIWRELEEMGIRGAKELAFGAKKNLREAWKKALGW